jgi:hypothetical protein
VYTVGSVKFHDELRQFALRLILLDSETNLLAPVSAILNSE